MRKFLLLAILMTTLAARAEDQYTGGDVSLLPAYEDAGVAFRDSAGRIIPNVMAFLADAGWNAIRVRLFVDPSNASEQAKGEGVFQNLDNVVRLAREIRGAGMHFMLDFHYSDTWADPSKQGIPRSWEHCTPRALVDSVYAHTRQALTRLSAEGLAPELIQVGNEITYGMLWPAGHVDFDSEAGWDTLTALVASGVRACREVCPEAKIILHTERAGEPSKTLYWYRLAQKHHIDYDIIGLSYYPMWHRDLPTLDSTLTALAENFPQKRVMIVETACFYVGDETWESGTGYPLSPEGQRQYTADLIAMLQRHSNVNGLFWWCPEENCFNNHVLRHRLNRGLFHNDTGRALPALYEMKRYR